MIEAELLERFSPAELRAIATRALAEGDDYSRKLLREQLVDEELYERSEIVPRTSSAPHAQSSS